MTTADFTARAARSKTPFRLEPSDVNRKAPLRDQIYELVRMMIIVGLFKPGEVVNEVEIAAQLQLSRTPVREAVKRISDEGLIVVRAQNGTFVSDFSRAALREAYLIRSALELESVRLAAENATPDHLQSLDDTIAVHEAAIRRQRYPEAIQLDDMFHRQIAEISNLSMLWRAVDISKAQMDRGRHMALPQPGYGTVTIEQHRAIVEALRSGSPKRAATAMKDHLDTSLQNTLTLLGEQADAARPSEAKAKAGARKVSHRPREARKARV